MQKQIWKERLEGSVTSFWEMYIPKCIQCIWCFLWKRMQVSFLYRRCWFIVVHLLIDDILIVCNGPCWITKDLVGSFTESRKTTLKRATLLGSNIAPLKGRDDFPFLQGEYVSSLEGKAHQDLSSLAWAVATARAKDSAAVALLRQADDMFLNVRKAPAFCVMNGRFWRWLKY